MILLPQETGVLSMTGRPRDKFTKGNTHGYVKKKKKPPMTFNVGNSQGFSISKAMEPIIFFNGFFRAVLPGRCFT